MQGCFKCGRKKPECGGARFYKHSKKADGSKLNSQEIVDAKLQESKEISRKRREVEALRGSKHDILGDGLPSWDYFLKKNIHIM